MTRNEFARLCELYLIAPAVALENDAIRAALAARDSKAVERLLATEF